MRPRGRAEVVRTSRLWWYVYPMSSKTVDDVQPKAVMTPDELARWNTLPPDEQLARLRGAIQSGMDSGPADVATDEIWAKIRARNPHIGLQSVR